MPHYELGNPYEADGHWYYPGGEFCFRRHRPSGQRVAAGQQGLTADGEIFDGAALTAAMQTDAVAGGGDGNKSFENGRQIQAAGKRSRGRPSPGASLIALSPRAAQFLLVTVSASGAPVHVQMDTVHEPPLDGPDRRRAEGLISKRGAE